MAQRLTSSFSFKATISATCCSSVMCRSQIFSVFYAQSPWASSWLSSSFYSCFAVYDLWEKKSSQTLTYRRKLTARAHRKSWMKTQQQKDSTSILTCFQFFELPEGSFFHRLTRSTHALQISPCLFSFNWKQPLNNNSYLDEDVNLELEDLAPQMQQPRRERNTRGRCEANIMRRKCLEKMNEWKKPLTRQRCSAQCKVPALSNSWERNLENNGVLCSECRSSMLRRGFLSARCLGQNTWRNSRIERKRTMHKGVDYKIQKSS